MIGWIKQKGQMESALKILREPHGITDVAGAKTLTGRVASIEFNHVNFGYTSKKQVLFDFNLKIKPGEKIGLVGVSGSGKSTLIALLQRFYNLSDGQIKINGQNIADVSLDSLRNMVAVIPQDTSLFNRTLRENIIYGNPKATEKQMIAAAKKANAHQFIMETEKGYDSFIGDRGIKLSGGQRQRIAIARAILKKAPILILDEATSALDSVSEQAIQKSLSGLMQGKTVIAIAHRLSTLKEMDKIVVVKKGRIVEQGTPSALLKKNGNYAKLWHIQTKLFEEKK